MHRLPTSTKTVRRLWGAVWSRPCRFTDEGGAGEDISQIGMGIHPTTAAAFDESVWAGAALASLGFADEEPFCRGQRGERDSRPCSVDFDASAFEVNAKQVRRFSM